MGTRHSEAYDEAVELSGLYSTLWGNMRRWREFRNGKQWTVDDAKVVKDVGHAPCVIDFTNPCTEHLCSHITANNPRYNIMGRGDGDIKIGKMFNGMLSYIWSISSGPAQFFHFVEDFVVSGMGAMLAYPDNDSSFGFGDLKIKRIDPVNLIIDAASNDFNALDADSMWIYAELTERQFRRMYPDASIGLFRKFAGEGVIGPPESDAAPDDGDRGSTGEVVFSKEILSSRYDTATVLEHYTLRKLNMNYVESMSFNTSKTLSDPELKMYLKEPAVVMLIEGKPAFELIPDQRVIQTVAEQYKSQGVEFSIVEVTKEALFEIGLIRARKYNSNRVVKSTIVGGEPVAKDVELKISNYPIFIAYNYFEGSPLGVRSTIANVMAQQIYSNKFYSLAMAYVQAATGIRVGIPIGSLTTAKEEFEKSLLRPTMSFEFDGSMGSPVPFPIPPIPNAVFNMMSGLKHMIEYQFGVFEGMMGNVEVMPETYRTSLSADQFAQRRMAHQVKKIDHTLTLLGSRLVEWAPNYYSGKRAFRILDNKREGAYIVDEQIDFDDYSKVIDRFTDADAGLVDVEVLSGSTLPTDRRSEYMLALEALKLGAIDATEFRKKAEIFDIEGIERRIGQVGQMQQHIASLEEQLKEVKGDLQTAHREVETSRKNLSVGKFTLELDKILAKVKAQTDTEAAKVIGMMENEINGLRVELEKESAELKAMAESSKSEGGSNAQA
jgi:hypothetical protein